MNNNYINFRLFNISLNYIRPIDYKNIMIAAKFAYILYWLVYINEECKERYAFLMISRKSMIEICKTILEKNPKCEVDESIKKKLRIKYNMDV